ncbi:MAG: hypothetical protein ACQEXJ_01440 [Myxococcota bacterium]
MKLAHLAVTSIFCGALALSPVLAGCDSSSGEDDVADGSGDVGFDPTDTGDPDDGSPGDADAVADAEPDLEEVEDVVPDVTPDPGPDTEDVPEEVEDNADVPEETEGDADVGDEPDADADDGDAEPDADPPPDDGECVPDCDGKVCGPDGCGSICGFCVHPDVCSEDQTECVVVCEQQCEGKECGDDGCGGTCGSCAELGPDLECVVETGLCTDVECEADCNNKVCGDNGCDGLCGTCAAPKLCNDNGTACELGPCGMITEVGECQGDVLVWCDNADDLQNQELQEEDCTAQGETYECSWDGFAHRYACVDAGPCEPDCPAGAECGGDGCGGTCGNGCADGWSCLGNTCDPSVGANCGSITDFGECSDDKTAFWWCNPSGKLQIEDCAAFGETCGWDNAEGEMGCVP